MSEVFRTDGRVALVTDASRGIGRAIAVELARAVADIALVARNPDLLEDVAAEVRALGRKAHVAVADLADAGQIDASIEACVAGLGPVDILVNNAGINSRGPIDGVTEAAWATALDVNLTSAFHYAQAVAPGLCERGWGRIVNIASISGQTGGTSGSVAYASSKGGLLAFTKTLARDLGPYRVTHHHPGLEQRPE